MNRTFIAPVVNAFVLLGYLAFVQHPQLRPAQFVVWPWALYAFHVEMLHYAYSRLCVAEALVQAYFQKREGLAPEHDKTTSVVHWLTRPALSVYATISIFSSIVSFTALCFFQGWLTAVCTHMLGALILPRLLPLRRTHHLLKIRDGVMNHPAGVRLELVALGVLASDFLHVLDDELSSSHSRKIA